MRSGEKKRMDSRIAEQYLTSTSRRRISFFDRLDFANNPPEHRPRSLLIKPKAACCASGTETAS